MPSQQTTHFCHNVTRDVKEAEWFCFHFPQHFAKVVREGESDGEMRHHSRPVSHRDTAADRENGDVIACHSSFVGLQTQCEDDDTHGIVVASNLTQHQSGAYLTLTLLMTGG